MVYWTNPNTGDVGNTSVIAIGRNKGIKNHIKRNKYFSSLIEIIKKKVKIVVIAKTQIIANHPSKVIWKRFDIEKFWIEWYTVLKVILVRRSGVNQLFNCTNTFARLNNTLFPKYKLK